MFTRSKVDAVFYVDTPEELRIYVCAYLQFVIQHVEGPSVADILDFMENVKLWPKNERPERLSEYINGVITQ